MSGIQWDSKAKADINIAAAGDTTVISAPTSPGYIAIDMINFVPASATTIQFKDGATAYGGAYQLTANQGFVLSNDVQYQEGIITCTPGNAFVINNSGAVQLSGFIRYRIVNAT